MAMAASALPETNGRPIPETMDAGAMAASDGHELESMAPNESGAREALAEEQLVSRTADSATTLSLASSRHEPY